MLIDSYKTEGIQLFQIHTMNEFDFIPRVSLFNKSNKSKRYESNFIVDISVRSGKETILKKKIGMIKPSESLSYDCRDLIKLINNNESIISFHLIPEKYYNLDLVSIEKEELFFYLTCQDHYVEYYNSSGFSSGVLYQSAPFNYKKFSNESTTIIQAPKVYTSSNLKTYLSLINNSVEDGYDVIAKVKMALVDSNGSIAKRWEEEILPGSVKFINLSSKLSEGNVFSAKGLYVLATNAVLLPLTFTVNKEAGSLALEHSLPPTYYSPEVRGGFRANIVKDLNISNLFQEA